MAPSGERRPRTLLFFIPGVLLLVYGLAQIVTGHPLVKAAPEIVIGLTGVLLASLGARYLPEGGNDGSSLLIVSSVLGALVMLFALVFAVGILVWGLMKGGSYIVAALFSAVPALVVVAFGIRGLIHFSRQK